METEAKLLIPDRETRDRLGQCSAAAGFSLEQPRTLTVRDTYLDTREKALFTAGFACRRREGSGRCVITLKSTGRGPSPTGRGADEAVHRRRELEVELAGYDTEAAALPARWPPGDARDLALALVGDSPLIELCCLRQDRLVRNVMDGRRLVASMSLDEVIVEGGSSWLELEIELAPTGRDRDLTALATWAAVRFGLEPCRRSKLDRALDGLS